MKKILKDLEDHFCAAVLLVMLILTFINVVARKLFLASMPFVEELTTCGLMILSIVGAAVAAKRGAHLGLSVITDLLPEKAQCILAVIADLMGAIFSALIIYFGIFMVQNEFVNELKTVGMSWPEWMFGVWLPIGGTVLFFRYIQMAFLKVKEAKGAKNK